MLVPFAQSVQAPKQSSPSEQIHFFLFEDTPAIYYCHQNDNNHSTEGHDHAE